MADLTNILNTNISPEALAWEIWSKTFYSVYVENIWNNVDVWRYISMFSILLLIFYKKKIRFFASSEEKIEKDKNIFINSDLIMTENFLKEFLIELSINESFNKSRYEKVKDYLNYFKNGDNTYINVTIKDSSKKLQNFLEELLDFLDKHFSEIHISDVYRLYPDKKHDPDFNYLSFQEQLYKLCRHAENLYYKYRLNVKSKLSI